MTADARVLALACAAALLARAAPVGELRSGTPARPAAHAPETYPTAVPRPGRATPVTHPAATASNAPPALDALDAPWRRAERALEDFVAYSRYPPWSRPIAEHAELERPNAIQPTEVAMRGRPGLSLELTQSRLFTIGGDRVELEVRGVDPTGEVPVDAAWAPARLGGETIDLVPAPIARGDGAAAAEVVLDAERIGARTGTIVLRADVTAGGAAEQVAFVLIHTGTPPARIEGVVGDALEDGSLRLDLRVEVERAGLYRLRGRLDDAGGRAIALLEFAGELEAGTTDVGLVAHGRLLRDAMAAPPWSLRDVEGWRLCPGEHPDREGLATWSGPYRTHVHRLEELSDAEWDSPERAAHLAGLETFVADIRR